MKTLVAIIVSLFVVSCGKTTSNNQETYSTPAPVSAPDTTVNHEEPTVVQRLRQAETLHEAMDICSPLMGDKYEDLSIGGACLAAWGKSHLTWTNVHVSKDETSPGLVFKNSTSQLGKRICSAGTVVEITENNNITEGELAGYSGTIYHFLTVGSSGSIVQKSAAHLCGIVVGTYSYPNSGGGTTHTIDLVGMWDLNYHPEY
jgi:hypothetical protein